MFDASIEFGIRGVVQAIIKGRNAWSWLQVMRQSAPLSDVENMSNNLEMQKAIEAIPGQQWKPVQRVELARRDGRCSRMRLLAINNNSCCSPTMPCVA